MELLDDLIQKNKNFAKWKLPNEDSINFIQEGKSNPRTDSLNFIIRPFESKMENELFFISKGKNSSFLKKKIDIPNHSTKEKYLKLTHKTISSIKSGKQKKIVISRVEVYPRNIEHNIDEIFNSLCSKHPDAFVFCYQHRQLGTWIGATPEQLISQKNDQYSTMALAGTKSLEDNSPWQEKEITEHQFVIDDIKDKIIALNGEDLIQHQTETMSTGTVKHLQTKITFQSNKAPTTISEHLHPTPAICGTPTQSALDFILKNEKHNRSCYSGYIGPIENGNADLFVNLRSMQVTNDKFILFLGGGITAESDPEKEWEETKNKAQTMLSVIQKC